MNNADSLWNVYFKKPRLEPFLFSMFFPLGKYNQINYEFTFQWLNSLIRVNSNIFELSNPNHSFAEIRKKVFGKSPFKLTTAFFFLFTISTILQTLQELSSCINLIWGSYYMAHMAGESPWPGEKKTFDFCKVQRQVEQIIWISYKYIISALKSISLIIIYLYNIKLNTSIVFWII